MCDVQVKEAESTKRRELMDGGEDEERVVMGTQCNNGS